MNKKEEEKIVYAFDDVVLEIIDAFGLGNQVSEFNLHIKYDEYVEVTTTRLVYNSELKKLIPILKKYNLVEKVEKDE